MTGEAAMNHCICKKICWQTSKENKWKWISDCYWTARRFSHVNQKLRTNISHDMKKAAQNQVSAKLAKFENSSW